MCSQMKTFTTHRTGAEIPRVIREVPGVTIARGTGIIVTYHTVVRFFLFGCIYGRT